MKRSYTRSQVLEMLEGVVSATAYFYQGKVGIYPRYVEDADMSEDLPADIVEDLKARAAARNSK